MDESSSPKIQRWIEAKWKHGACPMCASNNWQIGGDLAELRTFHGGNTVIGGAVYPILPVFCGSCGYALLINAVIADLLPDPPTPVTNQSPEDLPDHPPAES